MDLSKTTAFVSGANRGLGRHLAEQLIGRGAHVYGGARKPETIDTATGVVPVKLDITDPASVTAAAAAASDTTLLINNAGVLTATSLLTGDLSDINAEFGTNFYGTLAMARAFAGPIESNGGGTILNVLSILSWLTLPIAGAYSSAKTASWSMTNALRLELAPHNIRVSALYVAYMDTDMTKGFDLDVPKLDPADIASLALDGIAGDKYEIIADDLSRQAQAGLAGGVAALYPDLAQKAA
jgi:NAD(P)-dependent dehydrogenase (short-subunit alcohol dehydrogenase family)